MERVLMISLNVKGMKERHYEIYEESPLKLQHFAINKGSCLQVLAQQLFQLVSHWSVLLAFFLLRR